MAISVLHKLRSFISTKSPQSSLAAPDTASASASALAPVPASSPAAGSYVLNRDYQGSSRLNLQFFLWKNALQFNLHPDIPQPKANVRIADVATGTGIWLVDLASSLPPTVQLDGFDISLAQTPTPKWLPPNIKLHQWDMFTDPPAELVGQFDIVHVRLITLVIKDNNALPVINNLRKLLKPGGYLQWDEVDTVGTYIESADPSVSTTAIESLFMNLTIPKSARGRDDWKTSLPETLDQNGFRDSKRYTYTCDLATARYWHDMYMQSWEEFATRVLGNTEHTYEMINKAGVEAQNGAAIIFPKFVWVAKAV
ncbi:MAG: hypothetical protein M1830_002147 [Pleopsidium flavum]|nr:MAG: hypothetical protein M1830_002147 [Pleopsidium flavum]